LIASADEFIARPPFTNPGTGVTMPAEA